MNHSIKLLKSLADYAKAHIKELPQTILSSWEEKNFLILSPDTESYYMDLIRDIQKLAKG